MKKITLFMAAMLLMSANLLAQTKGDVNESGTVDAGDVAAVIDVMQNAGGVAYLPTSVKLNKSSFGFGVGMEVTLVPNIMPDNTTENTLTWSSSNPSVASVTQEGIVTGVAEGTTTITATTVNGKKATCEVTVSNTVYFWYVGQTNPLTMTDISPIVDDDTSPGWRLIGTTLPTYSYSNMLWSANDVITTGTTLAKQYIAIPAESSACPRDGAGNDASTVDMYNKLENVTIGNVSYKVYETVGKSKKLNINLF